MRLISSAISFARQPVGARRRWALVAALSLLADSVGFAQSEARVPEPESPRTVSFRNDVIAVLSKAGCNAGTCHGNKNGKGGFKLSLRGQDPDLDYLALTRDLFARRLDPLEPEQSLVLLKPTTQVAHEGGLRFKPGSEEYQILQVWLTAGMPDDSTVAPKLEHLEVVPREEVLFEPVSEVQLRARAKFSNDAIHDVTSLAVYEPANGLAKVSHDGLVQLQGPGETTVLVRYLHCQEAVRLAFVPARPGFVWDQPTTNNYIDEHIFAKLQTLRMNPSDLCSDDVFLRRAYLDLLGILPSAEEARTFVDAQVKNAAPGVSSRPHGLLPLPRGERRGEGKQKVVQPADLSVLKRLQKRARLIEELLERPEFADFWALKWADLLRTEAHSLDQKGVQNFHHWIRQCVAKNTPLDEFVRELVTSRGSTYESPAANYYRPIRDPLARARSAAQIFLGTRLQCAECHNHPSDRWTQDDYYDWAGVFARVRYKVIENRREIASDEHEWNGEQIVFLAREGSVKNPRTESEEFSRRIKAGRV